MQTSAIAGITLAILITNIASAEMITCPTQKQPNCAEMMPPNPMSCQRDACNVVSRPVEGQTFCLWSCAAHLDMFLNGLPMQQFLDAYKAYKAKPN